MLSRLRIVADELEKAGLGCVSDAAKFVQALEQCDATSCADLPFELDEPIRQVIDGAQSRSAMRQHCDSANTREAAAVLNTIQRICHQKEAYVWTANIPERGQLARHVRLSLSAIDDSLARLPLEIRELCFRPRLDAQKDLETGQDHQLVMIGLLAHFWAEDVQVRCGMSQKYRRSWVQIVQFARDKRYPTFRGFQGRVLEDERIERAIELIDRRR
jgi:hypothetical protein